MVDVVVHPLGPFNRGSDTRSRVAVTPGGSAANQAVALAAAGVQTHLVGLVGNDEFGRSAARALARAGLRAHLRVCPGQRTGVVVALVDASGERSMLTDRGANLCMDKATLEAGLASSGLVGSGLVSSGPTDTPRHLHLSGYELLDEATRPAGLAALELASSAGMTRSVDPCSAGPLATVGPSAFLAWTEGVEWCCANLAEGQALTGAREPAEVLGRLRLHFREVALTLGADGAIFSGPGTGLLHCPAERAVVADTTGAGDAFTGTFLARRLLGEAPEPALRAALAAAARVVTTPGARPWG
jgi:sugar/nucleoside kinase (ribokinase family)